MKYGTARLPRIFLIAAVLLVLAAAGFVFPFLRVPRVAIVIGHWQHGPGAACEDGLREVDVNMSVARLVADDLRRAGYRVDLLAEYDRRLRGYKALALVSLHADSCIPGASGFKVARDVNSLVPALDDALAGCLWTEYEQATRLSRDTAHITPDMYAYHAFRTIAARTPAAIVELGYLSGDRELLTERPETAARGVAAGIRCFLERNASAP
jgi:N-acetylmuramoyl-L-alanine amidase